MKKLNEDINRMKTLMNINEISMVKLKTTSYPNVKFDLDGTQNDEVNQSLLDDLQKAAKSVGVVATITTAKTGHNYLTTSKNVSRHNFGTAVDVSILDGIGAGGATNGSNGNAKFRELGDKLKNALVSMGYVWNTEVGNDKAVLWQTNTGGNHFNHLHISNKTGSSEKEPENMNVEPDSDSKKTSLEDLLSLFSGNVGSASTGGLKDIFNKIVQSIFNK